MRRFFSRPLVPALFTWAIFCLVLFYAVDLFLMPWAAGRFRKTSEVPKLSGLRMEKAEELLGERRLSLALDSNSDFSDLPAGRILSQFPDAGTDVKQGRRVWVRVSKGRRAVTVPSLRGMSQRQAEISLQQIGLGLGRTQYVTSGDVPAGAVIGTHPAAEAMVERGRAVEVDVSLGADAVATRMPSVVGLSLSQAQNQIEALHLKLGSVTRKPDSKSLPETVLEQTPPEGATLKGDPVDLVVSQ